MDLLLKGEECTFIWYCLVHFFLSIHLGILKNNLMWLISDCDICMVDDFSLLKTAIVTHYCFKLYKESLYLVNISDQLIFEQIWVEHGDISWEKIWCLYIFLTNRKCSDSLSSWYKCLHHYSFLSNLPKNIWDRENRFISIPLRDEKTPLHHLEEAERPSQGP